MRFQAVVFDAYGTLFDVYAVAELAQTLYPGQGQAIANLWRDKQLEYTRLVSLSDPKPQGSRHYLSFWNITQRALRYTLARLGLPHHSANEQALMDEYARLPAFADSLEVLQAIKAKGLTTAILSNADPHMLTQAVERAELTPWLDKLLSVDEVRHFKTTPTSYALVERHLSLPPQAVLFVSSNAWDALGATWYGFRTFWVNRLALPTEAIGPAPTFEGRELRHVLRGLE